MSDLTARFGCYLVEWYRAEVWQRECFARSFSRLRGGAELVGEDGASATVLMTVSVPTDDVIFGLFTARSPEAVAKACADVGLPAQRVSVAFALGRS